MNGTLRGWQARYVDEPADKAIPKYYNMPSMRKNELLYNFDRASRCPMVCLCEGVTDVWSVGPASVALFGKTLSQHQKLLIASTWKEGVVVVMLDGDDAGRGAAEGIADRLRGAVYHVDIFALEDGLQPDQLSSDEPHQQLDSLLMM